MIRQAMVLAAGKGTRLRPLTDTLPKPLVEVAGVPLIRLALRQLRAAGVTRAVINVFHLGDRIARALGAEAEGVNLVFSHEERILGTGGGIRRALRWLGTDPFLVVNADALQDVDLGALARHHAATGALATLAVRPDPDVEKFGPVGVDADGRVRRLVNVFDDGAATRKFMFTGVHALDARSVIHLPDGEESCIIRQGYAHVLRQGGVVQTHVHGGAFFDVGTPDRWQAAHRAVLDGVSPGLSTRAGAVAGVPIHLVSPRATVDATALVVPPVVIADGARVGPGAHVGPYAVVGRDARVEPGATVKDAVLLAGASVARGEAQQDGVRHGAADTLGWGAPPGKGGLLSTHGNG